MCGEEIKSGGFRIKRGEKVGGRVVFGKVAVF
jgi:hypothetical protein